MTLLHLVAFRENLVTLVFAAYIHKHIHGEYTGDVSLTGMLMTILLKRAYASFEPHDGFRVLVDRLWPRGVSKSTAHIDLWLKDIAPSTDLRKWFDHDPLKWTEFRDRYFAELRHNTEPVKLLTGHADRGVVTLVYGAKDIEHSHALALKDYLDKRKQHG